ncbi:MAG: selB, partial [Phycisphaerales bacterium]|nr:selB [Phycisphaerales bacterium]
PEASRDGYRSADRGARLQLLDQSVGHVPSLVAAHLARAHVVQRSSLLLRSRFSSQEVADALGRLAAVGKAVVSDTIAADAGWWKEVREAAMEAIDAGHKAHPERSGLALSDLRQHLAAHAAGPVDVFEALVNDLAREGFVRAGTAIRRSTHRPALPPHLQPAGARIRAALTAKPWDPPSRKELAPDNVSFQAMKFLLNTGEAVEVSDELVLHADHYQRAIDAIKAHLTQRGPATVSELRQLLNTSRRIMVPLLEKLDRDGVTIRQGDKRALRVRP